MIKEIINNLFFQADVSGVGRQVVFDSFFDKIAELNIQHKLGIKRMFFTFALRDFNNIRRMRDIPAEQLRWGNKKFGSHNTIRMTVSKT